MNNNFQNAYLLDKLNKIFKYNNALKSDKKISESKAITNTFQIKQEILEFENQEYPSNDHNFEKQNDDLVIKICRGPDGLKVEQRTSSFDKKFERRDSERVSPKEEKANEYSTAADECSTNNNLHSNLNHVKVNSSSPKNVNSSDNKSIDQSKCYKKSFSPIENYKEKYEEQKRPHSSDILLNSLEENVAKSVTSEKNLRSNNCSLTKLGKRKHRDFSNTRKASPVRKSKPKCDSQHSKDSKILKHQTSNCEKDENSTAIGDVLSENKSSLNDEKEKKSMLSSRKNHCGLFLKFSTSSRKSKSSCHLEEKSERRDIRNSKTVNAKIKTNSKRFLKKNKEIKSPNNFNKNDNKKNTHESSPKCSLLPRKKIVSKSDSRNNEKSNTKVDRIFDSKDDKKANLIVHKKTDLKVCETSDLKNSKESRSICARCKQFLSESTLKKHLCPSKSKDTAQCKVCSEKFDSIKALQLHDNRVHSVGKDIVKNKFQCDVCHVTLKYPFLLRRHKLTHTTDKPFKCNSCPKMFIRKEELTVHLYKEHTELKPFCCDLCDKSYYYKHKLRDHKKKHHGVVFKKQSR